MLKWLLTYTLVLLAALLCAQVPSRSLNAYHVAKTERLLKEQAASLHPSLKPFSHWQLEELGLEHPNPLWKAREGERTIAALTFIPLVRAIGSAGNNESDLGYSTYFGGRLEGAVGKKWRASVDYLRGFDRPLPYRRTIADSIFSVPSIGKSFQGSTLGYQQFGFEIGWHPTQEIELFVGRGKQFIGEGYRSLFLSDYAPNYNYAKVLVDVWKLKYMALYTSMVQPTQYPNAYGEEVRKYSASHYVSLNITDWWTVGGFDVVLWNQEDSAQKRNFDMQYLNPIIFFRPLEYGMGSADNSLLGFTSSMRPAIGWTLYAQVFLDDFVMREVFAPFFARNDPSIRTGWFGNKQAYQLGVKAHDPFGWNGATWIAEINVVRPYTFSHVDETQTYTHAAHPLAHPLGANFVEWALIGMYSVGEKLDLGMKTTLSRKGYTNHLRNMGEDPVQNNAAFVESGPTHGHFIGQGRRVDVANIRFEANYDLIPRWSLQIQAAVHHRMSRTSTDTEHFSFVSLGLSTALWNNFYNL